MLATIQISDISQLFLNIQVSALAAGNSVALKLSELSPATSSLIAELIPKYLDQNLVGVINGAVAESTKVTIP